jgi:hypothetical protein
MEAVPTSSPSDVVPVSSREALRCELGVAIIFRFLPDPAHFRAMLCDLRQEELHRENGRGLSQDSDLAKSPNTPSSKSNQDI